MGVNDQPVSRCRDCLLGSVLATLRKRLRWMWKSVQETNYAKYYQLHNLNPVSIDIQLLSTALLEASWPRPKNLAHWRCELARLQCLHRPTYDLFNFELRSMVHSELYERFAIFLRLPSFVKPERVLASWPLFSLTRMTNFLDVREPLVERLGTLGAGKMKMKNKVKARSRLRNWSPPRINKSISLTPLR